MAKKTKTKKSNAIPTDADLILKLYDLRREPVMRKARDFVGTQFWPKTYDEFKAVATAFGSEHNAYLRQVLTFWDMATAMVLRGAIDEDLFFECNGEPYFLYAKFKPFIEQTRKDFNSNDFMAHIEELANKTPASRERVKQVEARLKTVATQMATGKAAS